MVKDFFGHPRGACEAKGCPCVEFTQVMSTMTVSEVEAAGGRYMSCQRRSELTLGCVCGHDAAKHAVDPACDGDAPEPREDDEPRD